MWIVYDSQMRIRNNLHTFAEDWMREISCVLCFPYICLRYFLLILFHFIIVFFFSLLFLFFFFGLVSPSISVHFDPVCLFVVVFTTKENAQCKKSCGVFLLCGCYYGNGQWMVRWWWWMCVFAICNWNWKRLETVYYISDSLVTRIGYLYEIVKKKNVNLLFVLFCWSGTEYWILNAGWWLEWCRYCCSTTILQNANENLWMKKRKKLPDFEHNMRVYVIFHNNNFFFALFIFIFYRFLFIFFLYIWSSSSLSLSLSGCLPARFLTMWRIIHL